jgi:lipoprotein-anchoring transpeptidase ErfK/SrfK
MTWVERLWRAVRFVPTMETVMRTRRRTFALAVLAAAALAAPAAAQAANTPKTFEGVTVTRYLMGRLKPTAAARGAAHLWTNTGFSNRRAVYPVLRHKILADGTEWLQVHALRNRSQAAVWIPKWATRRVVLPYIVKVDLSQRVARIYRNGKLARRYRVVVGAPSTPTPTGHFYVVDRMHLHTSWANGQWALATSAFSRILKHFDGGQGEVALHARAYLPDPVGTAASHGCVRFNDRDIAWMASHVPNGTPVWIQK